MVNTVAIVIEGVLSLVLFPVIWFGLHLAFDQTVTALMVNFTLTGSALLGYNFAIACVSAMPIIILIGVNVWMINNAKQRSFED